MRVKFVFTTVCIAFMYFLLGTMTTSAQVDYSNCPDCTADNISLHTETNSKYQGIRGYNPFAPSTYKLIGKHKFSGSGWAISNGMFGENWYPIREEKQMLTGKFHEFGVSNYGDESDWNIHLLPEPGFEDFLADAIPYQRDNWYASGDWRTTPDGKFLIEAEITPDENRYGNPWFNNREKNSPLLNKKLTVYGPFVREEAHGNHPEIHPSEQIWWNEAEGVQMILLVIDDSNRFKRRADTIRLNQFVGGDYTARRVTTFAYQPWTQENRQEAEMSIAFEVNPTQNSLHFGLQALDDHQFFNAGYADVADGNKYTINYKGNPILTVQESSPLDQFVGVSFKDVCFNRSKGTVQGYIVLKTAIGNGDGKEGFVAIRVDKKILGLNPVPTVFAGDIANTWKKMNVYDDQVAFSDIISSDLKGLGFVHGIIDFNGNGKTDLFARVNGRWMILYDGKGRWTEINSSNVSVDELRFGDIDGDKKTDVLRVNANRKVEVSYGGTTQWQVITDAGEQNSFIQVGDFNGDEKTDIVYFKYKLVGGQPLRADMHVKYGARGAWKVLNNDYNLRSTDDYKNFRFGNFNGDKITDVFRLVDGKFNVYYNGQGDIKPLYTPPVRYKIEDLLFVDKLMTPGYTDIIYVDPQKRWTVYYGGREGSLPLTIKYADPVNVRFADIDNDPAVEPIVVDFAESRRSPVDEEIVLQPTIDIKPTMMAKYVPGSVKRTSTNGAELLTIDMAVLQYPGRSKDRLNQQVPEIQSAIEKKGSKVLQVNVAPGRGNDGQVELGDVREAMRERRRRAEADSRRRGTDNDDARREASGRPPRGETGRPAEEIADRGERPAAANATTLKLGTVVAVPVSGANENQLQVNFKSRSAPAVFPIPVYAITAVVTGLKQQTGAIANWNSWKTFLINTSKPEKRALLETVPALPTKIESLQFELMPLYSAVDEGKVRLVEMNEMSEELNAIAYGDDAGRRAAIFGDPNVFNIEWQYELRNLTTGQIMQVPSPNPSKGKWNGSKMTISFPESNDLLQLTATASIIDKLGNRSVQPVTFTFFNQQLSMSEPQVQAWLRAVESHPEKKMLQTKALFLAEDGTLTPDEVVSILR
jgi:hypothetical protein